MHEHREPHEDSERALASLTRALLLPVFHVRHCLQRNAFRQVHQEFAVITWNGESSRRSPPPASPKSETHREVEGPKRLLASHWSRGRNSESASIYGDVCKEPQPVMSREASSMLLTTVASGVAADSCCTSTRGSTIHSSVLDIHQALPTPQLSSSQALEQYGTTLSSLCRGLPVGSAQVLRGRGSGQGFERVFRGSTPRPAPNGCHKDGEGFRIHGPRPRRPPRRTRRCFRSVRGHPRAIEACIAASTSRSSAAARRRSLRSGHVPARSAVHTEMTSAATGRRPDLGRSRRLKLTSTTRKRKYVRVHLEGTTSSALNRGAELRASHRCVSSRRTYEMSWRSSLPVGRQALPTRLRRSVRMSGGKPDFRCRPSTFWLTRNLSCELRASSTRAMCVEVGTASSNEMLTCGFSPCCSRVQTPRGPRKSGIPAEVLMPAPVITTMCLEACIQSANRAILSSSSDSSSKCLGWPQMPLLSYSDSPLA
ncbi:uncharacterized protein LOC142574900 [Dermacentor variabilis]|uniref:uncharacterized protein LOC142574900 n=1 Tax=Dermacentor variabilis TaxID=34621 RepID=UPI003F5B275C